MKSINQLKGHISYILYNKDFKAIQVGESENIVTVQGSKYYVDQLSDSGGSVAQLMVLGTGTANVATTDTWVAGYYTDNGTITGDGTAGSVTISTHPSTASVLRYVGTFSAGYGTQDGITRVGLTNMDPSADGNGTADGTTTFFIAHGTISPTVNKGTSDTLVITWDHIFTGS